MTRLLTAFISEHGLPALIAEAMAMALAFVLLGLAWVVTP
jgi:hypothetical protein